MRRAVRRRRKAGAGDDARAISATSAEQYRRVQGLGAVGIIGCDACFGHVDAQCPVVVNMVSSLNRQVS